MGFPGGASGKEPTCQCKKYKRHGFDPWVRKIPWRRVWQPTPVFLPEESPGTEEPGGLQYIGLQRVEHDLSNLACVCTHTLIGIYHLLTMNNITEGKTQDDVKPWLIRMPCGRKRSDEQVIPCKWHLFAERHGEKKLQTERQVVRRKREEPFQKPLMCWHEQQAGSSVTREGEGISQKRKWEKNKGKWREAGGREKHQHLGGVRGWNCTWWWWDKTDCIFQDGTTLTRSQHPLLQCDLSSLPSGAGVFVYILSLKKCYPGVVDLQHCISFRCTAQWISYTDTHEAKWSESPSVVSNSLRPMDYTVHGILQARILEWVAFPLLQGIFPTQGLNPGLLHCRQILYHMSYQRSPHIYIYMPTLF